MKYRIIKTDSHSSWKDCRVVETSGKTLWFTISVSSNRLWDIESFCCFFSLSDHWHAWSLSTLGLFLLWNVLIVNSLRDTLIWTRNGNIIKLFRMSTCKLFSGIDYHCNDHSGTCDVWFWNISIYTIRCWRQLVNLLLALNLKAFKRQINCIWCFSRKKALKSYAEIAGTDQLVKPRRLFGAISVHWCILENSLFL